MFTHLSNLFLNKNKFHCNNYNEMDNVIVDFAERLKNAKIIDLDNQSIFKIDNIITDYLIFYKQYKHYLEIKISLLQKQNNEAELKNYYNHLIRIHVLYNEIYNFTHLMQKGMYYESYVQQKAFLENVPFNKILMHYVNESSAKQVIISIQLKIIAAILNFKMLQSISNQQIEKDLKQYLKELDNIIPNSDNKKNIRTYYLIKAFYFFTEKQLKLCDVYLGYLYNFEKDKYQNKMYAMPLQYTGLGVNPHLTMYYPNEFKNIINQKLIENKLSNKELKQLEIKLTQTNQERIITAFDEL